MTGLQKPVRRETATVYRNKPLIVELHAGYILLRRKKDRHSVTVDYRTILEVGYKLLARAEAREKAERRKQARNG